MSISIASSLSDAALVAEVKRLAGCERRATVELIVHLAELDARRLHLSAGFPSLFAYCTGALSLSEDAAFNRIRAARAARRFPCILDLLRDGSLNVTTVRLLGPRLTVENHAELLAAATGKNRRAVEVLLARRFPEPDTPATVRKLPAPRAMVAPPPLIAPAAPPVAAPASPPATRPPAMPPPVLKPLAPDRYRVTFTATTDTCDMLDRAKGMLRHVVPDGDTAEIMRRALEALLEKLERQKFAATPQPRTHHRAAKEGSRHVPAEVKRAVWIRDGGRCAFLGSMGRRCDERSGLEFHHVVAYARGRPATVANIQLRCRGHNAHEADLDFGMRRRGGEWDVGEQPAWCAGSGVVPGPVG
jgi:5-methylcytosine-specific restriction endonuclease McrA